MAPVIDVSIIIPHYNNKKILEDCIKSILEISYSNYEIIIVDNNSNDHSARLVKEQFPEVNLISSNTNLGYAGGCNLGSKHAQGEYLLFLNNDTVHDMNFLDYLVSCIKSNKNISSVQPKILDFNKEKFDYAGSSGGYIDYLVFPFTRGRIFNTIENDTGQYNDKKQIFWASGACFITKKNIFEKMDGFDERFFAHMEEIDYHWKCHLAGYDIYVEPQSIIYHKGGATLKHQSHKKTYLNHRNSLLLLLTNYSIGLSLYLLPLRLLLEFLSSLKDLFTFRFFHFISHYIAIISVFFNLRFIAKRRKLITSIRTKTDRDLFDKKIIFNRSIVNLYFLFNKRKYSDIIS